MKKKKMMMMMMVMMVMVMVMVMVMHLSLEHEQWLYRDEQLVGYAATAHHIKSRWAQHSSFTALQT